MALGVDRKGARILAQAGIVSQNDIAGLTDAAALNLVLVTDLNMAQVLQWRREARARVDAQCADRELVRGWFTGAVKQTPKA